MEILKTKAMKNYFIANKATEENCYDVAVSRYYYYLLLSIKRFIINKKREDILARKGSTHTVIIGGIIELLKETGEIVAYNNIIFKLWSLRDKRVSSDYKQDYIINTEIEFNKIFKRDFDELYEVFKKLKIIEDNNDK